MDSLAAVGQVRKLAAQAVVAVSTGKIDKESAAMLESAVIDTRGAVLAQQATTIQRAFLHAVELAFETSPGGVRLGCYDDGRVRFVLPWSSRSYRRYGLTNTTAAILRTLVTEWKSGFWHPATGHTPAPPPVFVLGNKGEWYVNLCYTSTLAVAGVTVNWPSLDTVAFLQATLTKKETAARIKRRDRKRARK